MINKIRVFLLVFISVLLLNSPDIRASEILGDSDFGNTAFSASFIGDSVSFNQKLIGSDFEKGRLFGRRVAISGDTAAISAWQAIPRTNKSQGVVYVFVRREGVWIQQAKMITAVARRKDSIIGGLAIDGDTIVAGVEDHDIGKDVNQGAAYVFTREGNNWSKKVRLEASGGRAVDLFGHSVGISGKTIIIGAPGVDNYLDDEIRQAHGAAYIFTKEGDEWVERKKIQGDDKRTGAFGLDVAIDNKTAAISVMDAVGRGVYIFSDDGTGWEKEHKLISSRFGKEQFTMAVGNHLAIDGNTLVFGGSDKGNQSYGAAYVYTRANGKWTRQAKLLASNGKKGDKFGWSLDISGNKIVVGSAWSNQFLGSSYLFARKISPNKTEWVEENIITAPDGFLFDDFGGTIGISGKTILIGASNHDFQKRNSNIGVGYIYSAGTATP